MPPPEAACGQSVRYACRQAGFEPQVRWETDDLQLLSRAVAAGQGVTLLPQLAIEVDRAGLHAEMQWARDDLARLLAAASSADLERGSAGTSRRWRSSRSTACPR